MYTVMVVDDDKNERQLILHLLQKYNYDMELIEASNGKEAQDIFLRQKTAHKDIDILITDIKMPITNGIDLARFVHAENLNTKILFISGYDDFEFVKAALCLNAVNYILKPINEQEFYNSIHQTVQEISQENSDNLSIPNKAEPDFYDEQVDNLDKDQFTYTEPYSSDQDNKIIAAIKSSLQLKDTKNLTNNIKLIFAKYSVPSEVSFIYVLYLYVNVLQLILNELNNISQEEFNQALEKLFTLKTHSQIKAHIQYYLDEYIEQRKQESQAPNYAIYQVEQYIENNLAKDLSLNRLASLVYLSPKYLSSLFSQVKGESLNNYITDRRLEEARNLLLNTNLKIADISERVGYSYPSYFSKLFQDKYKQTPDNYRKNNGKLNL